MLDGEQRQPSVCIKRLARDRLSQRFRVLADLECEIKQRGDYGNSTDKLANAAKALKSHGSPPNDSRLSFRPDDRMAGTAWFRRQRITQVGRSELWNVSFSRLLGGSPASAATEFRLTGEIEVEGGE
jgi:hypothetical protein